ncbi:hypothetical protein NDU88_000750 [Pleurodeles waltl]|uniref:Secreted protein n=1 Tax=Pleurodeles waltl TaxID=8319 RepID=A0AAV7MLF7_PLEWA|nr:hypothetical protein NDU88_000750 [Pleurodeles waltl]
MRRRSRLFVAKLLLRRLQPPRQRRKSEGKTSPRAPKDDTCEVRDGATCAQRVHAQIKRTNDVFIILRAHVCHVRGEGADLKKKS